MFNLNGDCNKEIRLRQRLGSAIVKELENISKCVSLETKTKIIHTLAFPMTLYRYESWTMKKTDRGKKD